MSQSPATADIHLDPGQLAGRTFFLGNDAGFVLYLPASLHRRDRTLVATKWFGASSIGRKYLETVLVFVMTDAGRVMLNQDNQVSCVQYLDHVVRTYRVGAHTIEQAFFVPDQLSAFSMTLSAGAAVRFQVEPEFDMRYYQGFNQNFDHYAAQLSTVRSVQQLHVSNHVMHPAPTVDRLDFYAAVEPMGRDIEIEIVPRSESLRPKTYLKDERRQRLIHSVYAETHQAVPDEAPIWDLYETQTFAPARIAGHSPMTLACGFSDRRQQAEETAHRLASALPDLRHAKTSIATERLQDGRLVTGDSSIDCAYDQVLTRFNNGLVARNAQLHAGSKDIEHYDAIFAGNKYYLDAWKRDENISLIGLLETGDLATVRTILDDTWQHQDPRTGRLPHIIRVGEPLVYFSSDGTLWALRRLSEYTRSSGDTSLLDAKYPMIEHFFVASLGFVKRGLLPSGGIIDRAYLWETWEDTPYTPRDGYPVEIELLWLTALQDYLPVIEAHNPQLAGRLRATLDHGCDSFELFHQDGYLADSLSYDWKPRRILTPNGYIAFGLDFPLPGRLRREMVLLGRDQLAGRRGIRSLAPRDWPSVLSPEFLADPRNVHNHNMASAGLYNYHRGIEWLWLNQFFVQAELTVGDTEHAYHTYVAGQVHGALCESGVGGLDELYDLRGPLGADFQAWSMTGFIASLRAFAGLRTDAVAGRIRVRPAIPRSWPYLECRTRIGSTFADVHYEAAPSGPERITVRSVGRPPSSYRLELGIRLAPNRRPQHILLNGATIDPANWRVVAPLAAGSAGELWVDTELRDHVAAEFSLQP